MGVFLNWLKYVSANFPNSVSAESSFSRTYSTTHHARTRYISLLCIIISVYLSYLSSLLSVDMLNCCSVPVLSADHYPRCGECTCQIQSLSFLYHHFSEDCNFSGVTCVRVLRHTEWATRIEQMLTLHKAKAIQATVTKCKPPCSVFSLKNTKRKLLFWCTKDK